MRIRTQLMASLALACVVAVSMIGASAYVTQQVRAGLVGQAETQEVARDVANMLSLTNEFSVYGGERAAAQWHACYAQLRMTIDTALARRDPASPDLRELRSNIDDLPLLFAKLEEIGAPETLFDQRRRDLLLERLLSESQEVIESRHRWAVEIGRAQQQGEQRYELIVLATPAVFLLLILFLGLLVARRVLRPLEHLKRSAAAIQRGDLSWRCGSDAQDELGEAARAVDAMALALQRQSAALATDITARKAAELQQAASERLLVQITDNVPALVAYVDHNMHYQFANGKYREWLGVDNRAMIGRHVKDAVSEAYFDEVRDKGAAALRGERVRWERHTECNGTPAHYMAEFIPDIAADGRVLGYYALTVDITERRNAELSVARNEQRLFDLTNSIPAMVGYFDMEERCQYANETLLRSQGLERADVPGVALRAVLGEANYAQHRPFVTQALDGRRACLEGRIPFEGRAVHFQVHLIPDRADGGAQRGFYLMNFDITALKEAQEKQVLVERKLRDITDNLPVLISYVDANERYEFINATCNRWSGADSALMIGRTVAEAMSAADYELRRCHFATALAGKRVEFEIDVAWAGQERSLHYVYVPDIRCDGSIAGVYTLGTDVTALKQVERELSLLARVDTLTELPNRRQFDERFAASIAQAAREGKPIALMFLDIDHFKSINDSFGHAAGDGVLREFARRLRAAVRITDTPARLAGDEFVVLLEGLHGEDDAARVAQKVLETIRHPFQLDGAPLHVTTSIGVAFAAMPVAADTLMLRADRMLYEAKAAGRNDYRLGTLEPQVVEPVLLQA